MRMQGRLVRRLNLQFQKKQELSGSLVECVLRQHRAPGQNRSGTLVYLSDSEFTKV